MFVSIINKDCIIQMSDSRRSIQRSSNTIYIDDAQKLYAFGNIGITYAGPLRLNQYTIHNALDIFSRRVDLSLTPGKIADSLADFLIGYWRGTLICFHLAMYQDGVPHICPRYYPNPTRESAPGLFEEPEPGLMRMDASDSECIEDIAAFFRTINIPDMFNLPHMEVVKFLSDSFKKISDEVSEGCGGATQIQIIRPDGIEKLSCGYSADYSTPTPTSTSAPIPTPERLKGGA